MGKAQQKITFCTARFDFKMDSLTNNQISKAYTAGPNVALEVVKKINPEGDHEPAEKIIGGATKGVGMGVTAGGVIGGHVGGPIGAMVGASVAGALGGGVGTVYGATQIDNKK